MKKTEKDTCISITKELQRHPICYIFDEKSVHFSADRISLSGILDKLMIDGYISVKEWEEEIIHLFSIDYDDEEYNETIQKFVVESKRLFDKLISSSFPQKRDRWCTIIDKYRTRLGEKVYRPPVEIYFIENGINLDQKICPQLQTDKEIKNVIEAISMLDQPSEIEEIISLIESNQPELISSKSKIELNVLNLLPITIRNIIKKTKEMFTKKGIEYPN